MRKLVQAVALATAVFAAFPVFASATSIFGPPGKIAFTSGRPSIGVPEPNTNDPRARIFVADYPSGTPIQATTEPTGEVRHRQPNWSPDHTRIAYAGGSGAMYALWILDLRTGSQTQIVPPKTGLDRPSWSPDGATIAYGAEGDLWVIPAAGGTSVRVTDEPGVTEERPVWSPDGKTLYYNRGPAGSRDLYKISPVNTGSEEKSVIATGLDEWQPSLSPDGKTLCYTRGPMDNTADVWLVGVNGGLATPFAESSSGNINCVWSPDGSEILYTLGVFTGGDLAKKDLSGNQGTVPSSWKVADHFDGNADWATNFPPECDPKMADVAVNQFTTVKLACVDPDSGFGLAPPTPDPISENGMEIVSPPAHGTIGSIRDDETVVYTPNKDFRGTDTFTYTAEDNESQADPATVTININAGGGGGGGDKTAPKISGLKVSPKVWSLGTKLAKISLTPTGTTISFRISEAAKTTLTFQRKLRKGGKTTYKTAGKITRQAKAGNRKVKFQGRLSKKKSLKPGTYRIAVGAVDASGNRAKAVNGPTFTIVTD